MAYLDNTGLAYFWGKIKAWANSVFALLGHTHPSSDVTLMTGYSMPASSGAISSGDTLNQAVGKLEKAITDADISNVVHRTGDETITGVKTVSRNGTSSALRFVNEAIDLTTTPNSDVYYNIIFRDVNDAELGKLEYTQRATSSGSANDIKLVCRKKTNDTYAGVYLGYDWDGIPFFEVPSTSASRSSHGNDVVTRDWIPNDARIVHTTGDETIAGLKTFTNNTVAITPVGNSAQLSLTANDNNNSTKRRVWLRNDGEDFWILHSDAGNTSAWNNIRTHYDFSEKRWVAEDSSLVFVNSTFKASTGCPDTANGLNIRNFDANANATHGIIFRRETNGTTRLYLRVHEPLNSANYADLTVCINENNYKYATAPTPDATANNVEIATAAWVRNFCDVTRGYLTSHQSLSNYVTLDSTQVITGSKTFAGTIHINNSNIPASGIPSSTQATNLLFSNTDNSKNMQGVIGQCSTSDSHSNLYLRAYKMGDPSKYADLVVTYDSTNDSKYASAPTPAATANSQAIATTAWVRTFCDTTQKYMKTVSVTGSGNAVTSASLSNGTLTLTKGSTFLTSHQSLANYVTINSAQTITGTKKFSDDIRIGKSSPGLACLNSDIADAKAYSGSGYKFCFICLYDNTSTTNDAHSVGRIWIAQGKDSTAFSCIRLDTWAPDSNHDFQGILFFNYAGSSTNIFFPSSDNKVKLGEANHRWIQLVAATGTISTSDERQKSYISAIDENLLDAWDDVEFTQYKFNDAIAEKSNAARFHTGTIAQAVEKACKAKNVDISKYGLFCYDSWDAKDAEYDDSGNIISDAVEAGDAYSLRYDEVLCVEAAWQRRKNRILEKRISDLEERLAALELRLGSE